MNQFRKMRYIGALLLCVGLGWMGYRFYNQGFWITIVEGIEVKVLQRGSGAAPSKGDRILMELVCSTERGAVIFDSTAQAWPLAITYEELMEREEAFIKEAIPMLHRGTRVKLLLGMQHLPKLVADYVGAMHGLGEHDKVLVALTVQDIMDEDTYRSWKEQRIENIHQKEQKDMQEQHQIDLDILKNHLKNQDVTATVTESGLHYVLERAQPEGLKPQSGDMVQVHYTGRLLGGRVFDTSHEDVATSHDLYNENRHYEPIKFQLGVGQVIKGWDEGIGLLRQGEKAKLFIPSGLAYGRYGVGGGVIPAHAILEFEVELVGIE